MLAAGSHPLQLFRGKMSDGISPLLGTPRSKRLVGPLKVGKIDVRRDCPPDREAVRVNVNNSEKPVSIFDFNRLCDQDFSGKHTPHCPPLHLLPSVSEQLWVGPRATILGKPVTSLTAEYLQTVANLRRAEVICPTLGSSNDPANDNTDPSEAEAA